MVYQDDQTVKIDDVILPGLVKSMEIKNDAQVDEQEVEGQSKKPKQATGYEDAKINIELILEDTQDDAGTVTMTRMQKLQQIQALFRAAGPGPARSPPDCMRRYRSPGDFPGHT